MSEVTALEELVVGHAAQLRFRDLTAVTVERTKLLILDTVGAAIAAVGADGVESVERLSRRWGGPPQAGIIGYGSRAPGHVAAMVNATLARALELDDVHERGVVHATSTVVPIALAASEMVGGVNGEQFLAAVAMGIDLVCRLSMAPTVSLGGEEYSPRSMSYTYQLATLVGALVAAKIAGLDRPGLADALGNGYSQCAGNLQGLAEGSLMVRVQQGLSASSAIVAMELAQAGVGGIKRPLTGVYGWFQAYYRGAYAASAVTDGLGHRYEVDQVSIKPYACCKYGHNAIAAAVEIAADPQFRLEDVERVTGHRVQPGRVGPHLRPARGEGGRASAGRTRRPGAGPIQPALHGRLRAVASGLDGGGPDAGVPIRPGPGGAAEGPRGASRGRAAHKGGIA